MKFFDKFRNKTVKESIAIAADEVKTKVSEFSEEHPLMITTLKVSAAIAVGGFAFGAAVAAGANLADRLTKPAAPATPPIAPPIPITPIMNPIDEFKIPTGEIGMSVTFIGSPADLTNLIGPGAGGIKHV